MAAKGRPRNSCVWIYFNYVEDEEKSVCLVKSNEGNCGHSIKGKFPTNLKTHLKSKHPKEFNELQIRENERKDKEVMKGRRTSAVTTFGGKEVILNDVMQGETRYSLDSERYSLDSEKYSLDSERYKSITKELAVFLGSTNVPISLVDNESFKKLIGILDSRYEIPDHTEIEKEITVAITKLKEVMASYLQGAKFLNICADIWTKRGMIGSFLGITAQFYSCIDSKRHNFTLAVRRLPSPYSAANVAGLVQNILTEWQISESKVHRILSDNGSGMIAAFKEQVAELANEGNNSFNKDETQDECSSRITRDNSDDNSCNEEVETGTPQSDINDFDGHEDDHAAAFLGFRRTRSFTHTLQLVVQVFDELMSQSVLLRRIHKLISKVNESTSVAENLITRTSRKLLAYCPTQWTSTYLMLKGLLVMKTELSIVLEELQQDNLPNNYWKQIESVVELLQPFAQYTQLTTSEETSVSIVIPVLMELQLHLEQMKGVHELVQVATAMQRELEQRFEYIINPLATNFDPLFVMCTFLHPGYKDILSDDQEAAAKCHLLKWMAPKLAVQQPQEEPTVDRLSTTAGDEEPSPKRFKHLDELLSEKHKAKESTTQRSSWSEEAELKRHSESDYVDSIDKDPFTFWKEKQQIYPLLSDAAFDLLSTPVSLPVTEQIYSIGSEAKTGKWNSITDSKLEREILFQHNKKYLPLTI